MENTEVAEEMNIIEEQFGCIEGEVCNRNGCKGIIQEHPPENCSCHIAPPCGACVKDRHYCPVCDWIAEEE